MTNPKNNLPPNHPHQEKAKILRFNRLITRNFMNCSIDVVFNGENMLILGPNGAGKTILANAITYAFDAKNLENRKDFEIKKLDQAGNIVNGLDHTVELHLTVNGVPVILKKNYSETYKKKPGSNEKQFGSNTTEFFIDGVATTMTDYQAFINTLVPENLFRLLITPFGFNELHWQERRKMLLEGFGNVSYGEIITLNPALSMVPEILQGHTVEEMLDILRKKYNLTQKDQKKHNLTQKDQKKHNLLLGEAKHKLPEEFFQPLGEAEMKEKHHSVKEQINADLKEPGMIILENYDFYWTKKDMAVFLSRWLQGQSVTTIANVLRPHLHPTDAQAEVTLLAYHFHLQKKIPCFISVENGCK